MSDKVEQKSPALSQLSLSCLVLILFLSNSLQPLNTSFPSHEFPHPYSPPSHSLISPSVYLYQFSCSHSLPDCLVFFCLAFQCSVLSFLPARSWPFDCVLDSLCLLLWIWLLHGLIPCLSLEMYFEVKHFYWNLSLCFVMLFGLSLPPAVTRSTF